MELEELSTAPERTPGRRGPLVAAWRSRRSAPVRLVHVLALLPGVAYAGMILVILVRSYL